MSIQREGALRPASVALRIIASVAVLLPVLVGVSLVTLSSPPAVAAPTCPVDDYGVITPAPTPGVDWSGCYLSSADLTGADLTNANLSFANLVGATFSGATLSGTNLTGARFNGVSSGGIIGTPSALPGYWQLTDGYLIGPSASLNNADLTGADLTNADLNGAELIDTNLTNADLSGANLDFVYSEGITGTPSALPTPWLLVDGALFGPDAVIGGDPDLSGADLTGAVLSNGYIENANLTDADLADADFSGALLQNDNLTNANLTDADLGAEITSTDITGANFTGAVLAGVTSASLTGTPAALPVNWVLIEGTLVGPGANLTVGDLGDLDFADLDLAGALFNADNLTGADFQGANLTGADFFVGDVGGEDVDTNLTDTNLTDANLTDADLDDAVLTGANLTGANHHGTTVRGASWSGTTCPNATNSNSYVSGCFSPFSTGYRISIDGATSASSHYASQDTLAASGLLSGMTGSVLFYTASHELLCTATLPTASCETSGADLPPGSYPGIAASYTDNLGLRTWPSANSLSLTIGPRARPSVRCAAEVGQGSTTVFKSCTPSSVINGSTTGPGPLLGRGGTFTWSSSGRTTVLSVKSTDLGKGQCPTGYTEYSSTGLVSGGTSTDTKIYDPVSVRECQSNTTKATRLLSGTTASL